MEDDHFVTVVLRVPAYEARWLTTNAGSEVLIETHYGCVPAQIQAIGTLPDLEE